MKATAKILDGIVAVVAACALGLTVYRVLDQRNAQEPIPLAIPSLDSLTGSALAPLPVLREDGGVRLRAFNEQPAATLIVYFRSTCPACEQTAPIWRDLVAKLPPDTRFIAINVEGLSTARAWLARHELKPDEVLIPQDGPRTVFEKWGISAVPLTVSLGPSGRIKTAKLGVLDAVSATTFARDLEVAVSTNRDSR